MNLDLLSIALRQTWKLPVLRRVAPCRVVGLLYHGISQGSDPHSISVDQLEKHIIFLMEHFHVVGPREVFSKRAPREQIQVLLTFDDGFRNHAEILAPVLIKHRVPALFFVSSRHTQSGKYLWFSYLRALKKCFPGESIWFRSKLYDMTPPCREQSVSALTQVLVDLRPHPTAMYDAIDNELPALESFVPIANLRECYAGMSVEQLAALAKVPYFCVAAHTVNHPYLSKCDVHESFRELRDNKLWIEEVTGQRCENVAYPSGDYDRRVLEQCRELGFKQGYSIVPQVRESRHFEIPRLGLYDPSLDVLGFKVQWGTLARSLGLSIG